MPPIRVLVADDSITVRKRMIAVLSADPELEVIAEAADGRTATEMCRRLRPDVMTMDVMMPVMDGVSATEYIMANCPTSILVVSSSSHRGEVLQTFDALAAGAVDVLDKPAGIEPRSVWEGELVSAVKMASRIRPITRTPVRGQTRGLKPAPGIVADAAPEFIHGDASIIAIGTSTGGPAAIAKVLSQIPADFPLSILLVIHIAPEFADGLLQWIAKLSRMPVRVAIDGEPLPPRGRGNVVMAAPDRHLLVEGGCLRVTDSAERHSCRPSVDVLFESVARECGPRAIACLLTGMGKDGARGLLAVRRSGGQTIAQDEASSIVFGMPREAIALGAAQVVTPLAEVASTLDKMARKSNADRRFA
jgi:two-component system, chemotaxis family, protein-glutamate methylesterase/glutaminase